MYKNDVKITYINNSLNEDMPKIFVFTQNELPSFNAIRDGVAWKVISNIGRNSRSTFVFPSQTSIRATWEEGANETNQLICEVGKRYTVQKNATGIVLQQDGNAISPMDIELMNNIQVKKGVSVQLLKGGNVIVKKNIVAYEQKAAFQLAPKIYWGIASEIQVSQSISSAVLDSNKFFEQDLANVSAAIVSLNGNAEIGYNFKIEHQE
ncbi:hypothetical protein [Flavobacterium sp. CF136]|jgi:hypothetical protein|uniref:hypothetical protein n=1 Tax=Flavobacterium sp. (strain CF136) TaxID=1144313 RepID=UPI000271CA1B|nr:hypothetical protein [Flavobacterium sp. CF136]EJL61192.1 hypothetical protein PMI10_03545 [Flavobacterium sp. CF136]